MVSSAPPVGSAPHLLQSVPYGDAFHLFLRLVRDDEPALLLDSCVHAPGLTPAEHELRRWSFAAAAPTAAVAVREGRAWRRDGDGPWRALDADADADDVDPFRLATRLLAEGPTVARGEDAPPFAGGVGGLYAYDAGRHVERIPTLADTDSHVPDAFLARFPAVLALHHASGRAWVAAADDAEGRAAARRLVERLHGPPRALRNAPALRPEPLLPRDEFEAMVERARDHVHAGDVFQVNLSHRLDAPAPGLDPLAAYARLRDANAAPMAGVLLTGPLPYDARGVAVLSSSPERLFSLHADGRLEARPIAGTRRRSRDADEDAALRAELATDEKERAEHVMLVDLARNDLGRVAEYGSVSVPRLLDVETYRRVHHLVSTVEARLADGRDAADALRALFPGGTITGAPKVRAMEIIEELEPTRRGAYTGSLGYVSATGDSDWNILIRTLVHEQDRVSLQVGAGIVWDSRPDREHAETLAKAEAVLHALAPDANDEPQERTRLVRAHQR